MKSENRLVIFVDGASKGNPGPSGVGSIVYKGNKVYAVLSKYIGITTNNVAEYTALIEILRKMEPVLLNKDEIEIWLKCDSELLARQLTGVYKIKNFKLKELSRSVLKTLGHYKKWRVEHIPRGDNKIADSLATAAVDNALRAQKNS